MMSSILTVVHIQPRWNILNESLNRCSGTFKSLKPNHMTEIKNFIGPLKL